MAPEKHRQRQTAKTHFVVLVSPRFDAVVSCLFSRPLSRMGLAHAHPIVPYSPLVSLSQFCEFIKGQNVPTNYAMSPPVGQGSNSGGGNTAMVASLTVTAALLMIGIVLGAYFVVKRRNGVPHTTESPKSLRQADSAQLDADGQILRDSMHKASASPTASGTSSVMTTSPRALGEVTETMVEIDEEDAV